MEAPLLTESRSEAERFDAQRELADGCADQARHSSSAQHAKRDPRHPTRPPSGPPRPAQRASGPPARGARSASTPGVLCRVTAGHPNNDRVGQPLDEERQTRKLAAPFLSY